MNDTDFPMMPYVLVRDKGKFYLEKHVVPYKGKASFDNAFFYAPYIPDIVSKPKKPDYLAITKDICNQ